MRLLSGIICALFMASCGARLPREISIHRPVALESALNLDELVVSNLKDMESVNIGQYMRERRLSWLVLTFGSKGCGVCMEKARYFQANLIDHYGILGDDANGKIQMVGVSTDPASSRDELLALVNDEGLSHLLWSDPGHQIMMRYFQPKGRDFSVPLTVMLSPQGIVWRVTSSDKMSPDAIIKKIAATMGSDARLPEPQPHPPGSGSGGIVIPSLARETPDRLDQVVVKSCNDRKDVTLGSILPPAHNGLRAVFVHKENCVNSAACIEAREALISWRAACGVRWNRDCSFKELIIGGTLCGDDDLYAGGDAFFDVFADHFNWGYRPFEAGTGKIKLPELKGPLSLIFDENGHLVYSKEGLVGVSLVAGMDRNRLSTRADGPDFATYANLKPSGSQESFSEIRSRTKYTMMMFWNTWCSSCTEELQEWHEQADSAYNFCLAHGDFCQVVALETGRAESGMPPDGYLAGLLAGNDDFDGWNARKWTMPLAVEDVALTDGRAPLGWFSGWIRARFGSSEPRTVLYDREGKVVANWRSLPGEHGPRDVLRNLFETNQ